MFKTNTAREIFYIFLWLGGIILLYTLVHTYILEPSTTKSVHTMPTVQHITNTHEKTTSTQKITKKEPIKVAKSVAQKIHNTIKVAQTTETQQTNKIEVKPTTTLETAKIIHKEEKKTVVSVPKTKETEETQAISTPSIPEIPKAVSMPTSTISIPTVPTVPSAIPSTATTEIQLEQAPTKTQEVVIEEKIRKKEIHEVTDALEKELSQDEQMQLIEKARQMVIEKAEKARSDALEAIER